MAKNRLEPEVLKEQLKLVIEYLSYIQKTPNQSTLISENKGKILLSGFIPFSIINYNSLLSLEQDKYITHKFDTEKLEYQWFNEVNNDIIYNPFFPKELFDILVKLDTKKYLISNDIGSHWCFHQEDSAPEKQLVLMQGFIGSAKEDLNTKMLKFPYKDDYLKINDIVMIYNEFNSTLEKWLKNNHINIDLNIKYN